MLGQFLRIRGSRRRWLDATVRQVAELSAPTVCGLAAGRVEAMSVCESRGYIRARAGAEIRRQTRAVVERNPEAGPNMAALVAARATERVVALAMRQLTTAAWRAPIMAPPTYRRQAA
jgi:hypothetical protein